MILVRHESAAVAMAAGYARATQDVGTCAVTSGPGLTQVATSLIVATRAHLPMVLVAGDTATSALGVPQDLDQSRFVEACGSLFQPLRDPATAGEDVQLAYAAARRYQRPVVLNLPRDLQREDYPWDWSYTPSREILPPTQRVQAQPKALSTAAELIRQSSRPVILAGRGAMLSGCREEVLRLAEMTGALLATTLPAKGWLDCDPFCVGIAGAFSSSVAEELFTEADLVIAVGASLNAYTTEGRLLFPSAGFMIIDDRPGAVDGANASDRYVVADARDALRSLIEELRGSAHHRDGFRTSATTDRFRPCQPRTVPTRPGTVNPRELVRAVERSIGDEAVVLTGVGHYWPFPVMHMHAPAGGFFSIHEYLAIGQCLSTAIGVAVARPTSTVVAFEGDASFMMQLAEIETAVRHGIRLLVVVINDQALGAELHGLEAEGIVEVAGSTVSTPALDEVARALGARGRRATTLADVELSLQEFDSDVGDGPYVLDARVDPQDVSELFKRMRLGQPNESPHQGRSVS
jgi:thiamine pyrophosphate-dependent acetolactate synthase large subunit-like protein